MFLKTYWFGCFLFDDSKVVDCSLFPKDASEVARRYSQVQKGEVLEEERVLVTPFEKIMVEEKRLLKLKNTVMVDKYSHQISVTADDYHMPSDLLRRALLIVYTEKLSNVMHEREIMELIASLDDLNRTINLLRERENEWGKMYVQTENSEIYEDFMERIQELEEYKDRLVTEIEVLMRKRNPSLSTLVGELLGARLVALAGGRERLARLPASTIQILGAENAFFRFRKLGKGMPKHGIIFQHPWIRGSKKQVRGKIARALASKIALAARIDYYSGRDDGDILKSAVEERIRKIRLTMKEH